MQLKNKDLFIERCLIGNNWCNAYDTQTLDIINPATGEVIGVVPNMGIRETQEAINMAYESSILWREKSAEEKYSLLKKWYDLIIEHADDLAMIITSEQGKPLNDAYKEIQYAASFVIWFAEEAKRINGMTVPSHIQNGKVIVTKEAVGVCAAITPWNFPAAMITRKVAPALAAGCTVIIKPAPETPFTALALAKLALDAEIDCGAINVITGDEQELGKELTTNPKVRKLSFTGSTAVGKLLMEQSASTMKKVSMELGGNAPFIVCADADIEKAVSGAVASRYRNNGQTCICANRIFVHSSLYQEFTRRVGKAVEKLKVGNGLSADVNLGPLINQEAVNRITYLIEDAVNKGANVIVGGKPHSLGGCFFEPTVITHANTSMNCFKEEIFGPIATIFSFDNQEEVIRMANDTNFGLAAYIYSENTYNAILIGEKLEYGMIGINEVQITSTMTPFGGMKQSGFGKEGSVMGIEEYLNTKCTVISHN